MKKLYRKKPGTEITDKENIDNFYNVCKEFYDFVIENIREYQDFFIKKNLDLERARKDNQYLSFRPVGLVLIAKLYAYFHKSVKIYFLKDNINKIGFKFSDSPFNGILWNRGKMEVKTSNQNLAYDLSLHLLGEKVKTALMTRYQETLKNENARLPNPVV